MGTRITLKDEIMNESFTTKTDLTNQSCENLIE